MSTKEQPTWHGHPLLDAKHAKDLELSSAIEEFHHGHDRATAEQMALDSYRKENHAKAAAHHLNSMKKANASGATDEAKRHYDMYSLHCKALGHDAATEAVPDEVKKHAEGEKAEGAHTFKPHPADQWLVNSLG